MPASAPAWPPPLHEGPSASEGGCTLHLPPAPTLLPGQLPPMHGRMRASSKSRTSLLSCQPACLPARAACTRGPSAGHTQAQSLPHLAVTSTYTAI